jgi:hypothetical protein
MVGTRRDSGGSSRTEGESQDFSLTEEGSQSGSEPQEQDLSGDFRNVRRRGRPTNTVTAARDALEAADYMGGRLRDGMRSSTRSSPSPHINPISEEPIYRPLTGAFQELNDFVDQAFQ